MENKKKTYTKPCMKIIACGEETRKALAEEPQYEQCVLCKQMTDIPSALPIQLRKHYMEGIGQLCESCARELKKA